MKYRQEDIYLAFCGSFRNAELSKKLHVELCRRMDAGPHSTLFREIAGRPEGMGAWFTWAGAEPLDVSLVRDMAGSEVQARVFTLESGRSCRRGHGNPLQYSCLENSHGQRSLAGYSPWGLKELDTTEVT